MYVIISTTIAWVLFGTAIPTSPLQMFFFFFFLSRDGSNKRANKGSSDGN